jgi:hypothetical protein
MLWTRSSLRTRDCDAAFMRAEEGGKEAGRSM